ncbi:MULTISPECIES: Gfo/Idh/MocA family protein [Spirosoma]|uniref:Gfo/Idh/MocA family oxidoreductase n=1 Tax=Spirosoma sordidisoli TaxID=2502893 RepID=A0A4Q2UDT6_9BACT|nr:MULTISPECIES: Gfo/Idh/MocA family oxidoreductase [Spirosoma]RYC67277.1 Gfo/Idh/MocA family oxidoreductase [Spirosoma sordidisoli]
MTRWGILGPGRIAHKFAQDLLTVPDAQLYAVASTDQQRAEAFAGQYGAPHALDSYEGLLTLPDLDVVYVATPHVKHYENVMMLLNGGIPVLGEKPFAMNSQQVQTMVDTARSKSVFLMEALWSRFMPVLLRAKQLVDDGAIGTVTGVRADFGFAAPFTPDGRLYNKALGGGSLLDIGIYPLFWSYLMLGMPASIKASATFGTTGVDEQCGMVLTYPNGELALLDSTLRTKTPCEAFIHGTEGQIRVHGRWHETEGLTLVRNGHEPETFTAARSTFGYEYEAQHVMQCLRDGRTESPLWSLTDSLNLMSLLDSVRAEAGIVYE